MFLKKIFLIFGIVLTLAALAAFFFIYNPKSKLEVDFFDVGQGDAILIQTPYGQNILIDGGPDQKVIRELGKYLSWRDRRIDLMILTHPHDDHVAGLVEVIKRYEVKKIIYTGAIHTGPAYLSWLEAARDKKIPLLLADRPQTVALGENCGLRLIYPLKSLAGLSAANLNNTSIVSRLDCAGASFLFSGDIETEAEKELLAGGEKLEARVLKVAHHGSDTSSGEDFLAAVKPRRAVISVGKDNDFGHPSRRILKRLQRIGAEIFRTDENGGTHCESDGGDVSCKSEIGN